mgnify:FL=1
MKKLALLGTLLIIIGIYFSTDEKLSSIPINELFSPNIKVTLDEKNKYYREYDFNYVQNTDNFSPECKQDLLNIYYTVINAGKNEFTFYCGKEYETCISDLETIANNQNTLSPINNYVHPYNGFKHIETEYDNNGKITIYITKSYTEEEIQEIEQKLDTIEQTIIKDGATEEQNIKAIHDYIIDNATYDTERKENSTSTSYDHKSDIAYGPLIQGYSICSGYTDAMELMLDRLSIENYKVASENHVWNAVKLDGTWRHLDLTWDDPVVDAGINIKLYDYYLITTSELLNLDQTEHNFNQDIYSELKEA